MGYSALSTRNFLANLGTFWSQTFHNFQEVYAVGAAGLFEYEQALLSALDAVAALSRFNVPLYKVEYWTKLRIYQTESNRIPVYYLYDGTYDYGDPYVYGQERDDRYQVTLASNVKAIGSIVDKPVNPEVCWLDGIDFTVEDSLLKLNNDPFHVFPVNATKDADGNVVTYVDLWFFSSKIDLKMVHHHFGYVLDLYLDEDPENYKHLINATWDTLLRGATAESFRSALGALFGVPVVRETEEVVTRSSLNDGLLTIITDKNVYEFTEGVTPVVSPGDTVKQGDFLVDTISIFEPGDFDSLNISGVIFSPEMITRELDLNSTLFFENATMSVSYTVDDAGVIHATFPISGRSEDVTSYWDFVAEKESTAGPIIARALTGLENPQAGDIPDTVNPMKFITQALMGHNLLIVNVKTQGARMLTGFGYWGVLKRLIPNHVALICSFEVDVDGESLGGSFSESTPGPLSIAEGSSDSLYADTISHSDVRTFRI